jgi:hypothetical protein
VAHASSAENLDRELKSKGSGELQTDDLGQLFGIDLATGIDFIAETQVTPSISAAAAIPVVEKTKSRKRAYTKPPRVSAPEPVRSEPPQVSARVAGKKQAARKVAQSENASDAILASIARHFAAKSAGPSLPPAAPVSARGRKKSSK